MTLSSATETRDGLQAVGVGKQLLEGARPLEPRTFSRVSTIGIRCASRQHGYRRPHRDSHPQSHDGSHTNAISAFFYLLKSETPWQQRRSVKEIWESGAGT